jgi:hypothetical protein
LFVVGCGIDDNPYMNIATFIFGIVPSMEEGDPISATCLEGAVWLRLYPTSAFVKKSATEEELSVDREVEVSDESFGDPLTCLKDLASEALAESVVGKGGEAFSPFLKLIEKLIGLGCKPPDEKLLRGDAVLYATEEMGCDETPFEAQFEDALLVYRVIDSSDEAPPKAKAGEQVELPGFESDPDSEFVLLLKS